MWGPHIGRLFGSQLLEEKWYSYTRRAIENDSKVYSFFDENKFKINNIQTKKHTKKQVQNTSATIFLFT